jgi:hypothetical protein
VHPLAMRRIDRYTGKTEIIDSPCGARLASTCKPCAERNRRLRQTQIREGWHLTEEPSVPVEQPSSEVVALLRLRAEFLFERERCVREELWPQVQDLDRGLAEVDELLSTCRVRGALPRPGKERKTRTVRSTKPRQDAPKLLRRPIENRTLGRVYRSTAGKEHRPSMLLTVTLPGFGAVHTGKRMRRGQLEPCACGRLHGENDGGADPVGGEDAADGAGADAVAEADQSPLMRRCAQPGFPRVSWSTSLRSSLPTRGRPGRFG